MQLKELCKGVEYVLLQGSMETFINDIIYDSRKIRPGCIFICMEGVTTDGHAYASEAVRKNASVIIVEDIEKARAALPDFADRQFPKTMTVLQVKSTRYALALMSSALFGHPDKKLTTIGVTGTKGKTTIAHTIKAILDGAGHKTGIIGSIGIDTGKNTFPTKNTTPESYEIHKNLAQMVKNGCQYAVMEVSSQGLKQNRTAGIIFDYGIFSNISMDHIGKSEHATFEEYLDCKKMLFKQCAIGIINIDSPYSQKILEGSSCKVIGVSIEDRGCQAKNGQSEAETFTDVKLTAYDLKYIFEEGRHGMTFKTQGLMACNGEIQSPGEFSVYNVLLSMALCSQLEGITENDILRGIKDVKVKGRLQSINISRKFDVIIDYAHNEDSARNVLNALSEYSHNRLICVFGCAGNRSRKRRYGMGKVIGEIADLAVVTDENPRFEEPEKIIADIAGELDKHSIEHIEIRNRKEALAFAITHALPGDMIVSLGKGHENYFDYCGVRTKYSEQETIKEIADEIRSGKRKMKYMEL